MKKFASLTLSLALTASLAAPAFAAEDQPLLITPISAPLGYAYTVTVNGVALDAAKLPAAAENYIPGRLVAESDHGSASWYAEENSSFFYFDGLRITVNFADNSITMDEKALEATALVKDGITYLPVSVFDGVEGYTVVTEDNKIDITTPNNDPLVKFSYSIIDEIQMSSSMKSGAKDFFENLDVDFDKNFESGVIFGGMNINPDYLLVAKLAKGADMDAIKAGLETYRKSQEDTFTWYMSQHLEKVQNAKTIVKGDYLMFVICEDYDKAEEMFTGWVAEQK